MRETGNQQHYYGQGKNYGQQSHLEGGYRDDLSGVGSNNQSNRSSNRSSNTNSSSSSSSSNSNKFYDKYGGSINPPASSFNSNNSTGSTSGSKFADLPTSGGVGGIGNKGNNKTKVRRASGQADLIDMGSW